MYYILFILTKNHEEFGSFPYGFWATILVSG